MKKLIKELKEIKKQVNNLTLKGEFLTLDEAVDKINELIIDYDYNLENIINDSVVSYDLVNEKIAEIEDIQRVACYINQVTMFNVNYFYINGYANLEDLTLDKLNLIFDELIEYVENNEV